MKLDTGEHYLSEISLNGGIKRARITRKELDQKKKELLDRLTQSATTSGAASMRKVP